MQKVKKPNIIPADPVLHRIYSIAPNWALSQVQLI